MPRIVFSEADLDRVTLAERPHMMWEMVLSLHVLQHEDGRDDFGPWRRRIREAARDEGVRSAVRRLCELDPNGSYFPDFLTPFYSDHSGPAAINRVMATPQDLVRREVSQLALTRPLTPWLRDLAASPHVTRELLQCSLTTYYRVAIEPLEAELIATVTRDAQRRESAMRKGGVDALFAGFDPEVMHWEPPVLEVVAPGVDVDLRGRGLTLIPSTFCWQHAITPADPAARPTVVYPARRKGPVGTVLPAGPPPSLEALLGRRRAAVLAAVCGGGTTSAVAERLDLPLSSVSEHIAVLRDAGLVISSRRSRFVVHTTTLLGEGLLER